MTTWEPAELVAVRDENDTAKTLRLRLPRPSGHLAGQHYILRLTAPDGYTASRSYSVASAPDGTDLIDLTVERLPDGEVSSFLHDEARPGDVLEVRGPIGRWFVWEADGPALLIAGGSGLVPLMAMLRLARQRSRSDLVRLLVSVRAPENLYYADELPGTETTVIYSRRAPESATRPPGRMSAADLSPLVLPGATVYVCGSSAFADTATDVVMALGLPAERIRVERFGPTR